MGIVARQGIYSAISLIIGFGIGAFNNLVVLKWFEEQGEPAAYYGLINLMITWAVVFSQVLNFGSGSIVVRYGPKFRSQDKAHYSLFYVWIFPLAGTILLAILLKIFGTSFLQQVVKDKLVDPDYLLWFLFGLTVFMTFFRSLSGYALSLLKSSLVTFMSEIAIRIFVLAGVVFYFLQIITIQNLFITVLAAYFLQVFISWILLGNLHLFRFGVPEKNQLRESFHYGMFSVLDSGANMLVNRIDIIMIGSYLTLFDVNYYNFAFFASMLIALPARSLSGISVSVVAEEYHQGNMDKIEKLYRQNSLNQFLSGGFIFICIYAGFDSLISYMPPEFRVAKYAFLFLSVAKLFDLLTSINSNIIQISKYYRYNLYFNIILLLLAFVTNILMIPRYGIVGAALATAISVFLSNAMKTYFLFRWYRIHPFEMKLFYAAVCLAVPLLAGLFIPDPLPGHPFFNFLCKAAVTGILAVPIIWFSRLSEEITNLGNILLTRTGLKKND